MSAQHMPLPAWPGTFQRPGGAWRWLCPAKSHGFLLMSSYSLAYVDAEVAKATKEQP